MALRRSAEPVGVECTKTQAHRPCFFRRVDRSGGHFAPMVDASAQSLTAAWPGGTEWDVRDVSTVCVECVPGCLGERETIGSLAYYRAQGDSATSPEAWVLRLAGAVSEATTNTGRRGPATG
jgi:hypothetical protein